MKSYRINGERIDRLDFQSLVDLLKASRSRPVRLGVIQPGGLVPEDFNLRPAEVALPSVDKAFLWSPGHRLSAHRRALKGRRRRRWRTRWMAWTPPT